MTLLQLITKASSSAQTLSTTPPDYPLVLDPDSIFSGLIPKPRDSDASLLPVPLTGWRISQPDSDCIELCKKFFAELEGKLQNPKRFGKEKFLLSLKSFLESVVAKSEVGSVNVGSVCILVEKVGLSMGKDVAGLILRAGTLFEDWELVKTLVVNELVGNYCYKVLVPKLVEKGRSDLLCLCVMHASDLGPSELLLILQHFLGLPRSGEGVRCAEKIRKELEEQAVSAIEKAVERTSVGSKSKEAAILLTVAHDGFSSAELCLHYLVASANLDEVVLSGPISKLNGRETMKLIRYLRKWLNKYERFPQAVPCPKAPACDWVPKLEDVVKFLGVVLDENFSTLVLHPEFHEELRCIETVVGSLALEASFCASVASVAEKLKIEVKGT